MEAVDKNWLPFGIPLVALTLSTLSPLLPLTYLLVLRLMEDKLKIIINDMKNGRLPERHLKSIERLARFSELELQRSLKNDFPWDLIVSFKNK